MSMSDPRPQAWQALGTHLTHVLEPMAEHRLAICIAANHLPAAKEQDR